MGLAASPVRRAVVPLKGNPGPHHSAPITTTLYQNHSTHSLRQQARVDQRLSRSFKGARVRVVKKGLIKGNPFAIQRFYPGSKREQDAPATMGGGTIRAPSSGQQNSGSFQLPHPAPGPCEDPNHLCRPSMCRLKPIDTNTRQHLVVRHISRQQGLSPDIDSSGDKRVPHSHPMA